MGNKTRKLVAVCAVTLALLSLPAAASDNRTTVGNTTQAQSLSTTSDTVVDIRLLMLDRDLYPSTYQDHPYTCSDGNCTDW